MNYQEAVEMLRGRSRRRLPGRATYLVRNSPSEVAVLYHRTFVVSWFACGRVQLDMEGWDTVTTRERINRYSPLTVWRHRGVTYVCWGRPSDTGWARTTVLDGRQSWKEGRLLNGS